MPPLIGPAPLSVFKRTASGLGCVMDGATDNTVILNAWLATASASNPIVLEIDGPCATTGLVFSAAGYTTIQGVGTNAVLYHLTATDNLIRLGPYLGSSAPSGMDVGQPTPAIVARNIVIANLRMDGNYTGNRPDTYRAMVDLVGCANLTIRDCSFENNPWYGIRLGNINGFRIIGNRFYPIPETTSGTQSTSQDGCHINGSCFHGTIVGNLFHSVDDAIALNAPEGYGTAISDITITGNEFFNCPTWVRAYATGASISGSIARVSITGNAGSALAAALIIGNCITPAAFGKIIGLSFVSNEVYAPNIALISENVQLYIGQNEWHGGIGGAVKTYVNTGGTPNNFTIENLTVDGLQIMRTPSTTAQTSILDDSTASIAYPGLSARTSGTVTVRKAVLRNINVVDVGFAAGASSLSAPLTLFATQSGTTLASSILSDLDGAYFATFGTGSGITSSASVAGSPPLSMTFPDSNVANNVCYLSLNSGALSLRLNGVTQLLSPAGETSITSSTTAIPTNVELVTITLAANYSPTIAAGYPGQNIALQFVQNSTGGFAVTYPANVLGGATVATAASKRTQQVFTYSGSQSAWVAQSGGVAGY